MARNQQSDEECGGDTRHEIEASETFRPQISGIKDINDATKRFNSILNELHEAGETETFQVAVVEVEE